MTARADTIQSLVLATSGLLVWVAHFGLMYATQTAFCALTRQSPNAVSFRVIAIALTTMAVAALIGFGMLLLAKAGRAADPRLDAGPERFLHATAVAVIGIALIAVLWSVIPMLLLPTCAAPAA
jgi:hypothetical protein